MGAWAGEQGGGEQADRMATGLPFLPGCFCSVHPSLGTAIAAQSINPAGTGMILVRTFSQHKKDVSLLRTDTEFDGGRMKYNCLASIIAELMQKCLPSAYLRYKHT